jgi:hypothetical protein
MNKLIIQLLFLIVLTVTSCKEKRDSFVYTYNVEIVEKDSLFYLSGRFSAYDSLTLASSDGVLINIDKMLFDYNDSLIQMSNSQLIPKSVGTTIMKIRYPNSQIDSFIIDIRKLNGKFIINRLPA